MNNPFAYFTGAIPVATCHTEGSPVVFLPFSAYELANLAELFRTLDSIYPPKHGEPNIFAAFNSGDWTNVLTDRFINAHQEFASDSSPNQTAEDYRQGVIDAVRRILDK